jgi:hypothetical protein
MNTVKTYINLKTSLAFLFFLAFHYWLLFPTLSYKRQINKNFQKSLNQDSWSSSPEFSRRNFISLLAFPVLSFLSFKRVGRLDYKSRLYRAQPSLVPYDSAVAVALYRNTQNMPKIIDKWRPFWNFKPQAVNRNNLPKTITHLTFGQFFNHSVINLPKIIKLTFSAK